MSARASAAAARRLRLANRRVGLALLTKKNIYGSQDGLVAGSYTGCGKVVVGLSGLREKSW